MASVPGSGKRRQKVLRYFRSRPGTQHNQANDSRFFGGSTGCSATSVQHVLALHGKRVTLDDIGKAVGYPDANQYRNRIGLYDHQVVAALAHFGVRYRYTSGEFTASELQAIAVRKGPVLFACTYGSWPQRKGARYYGLRANGRPNGYARDEGGGGKDQLSGFEQGRHMGILLSKRHRKGTARSATKVYLYDPNHGSLVRPTVPAYDVVSPRQWDVLYRSARQTSKNGRVMACVPLDEL